MLFRCPLAANCWALSCLTVSTHHTTSIREWIFSFLVSNPMDKGALFMMICWRLWSFRNNKVCGTERSVVNLAGQMLLQWQQAQVCGTPLHRDQVMQDDGDMVWTRPENGWYKVNVDAALFSLQKKIGLGCIVRDSQG